MLKTAVMLCFAFLITQQQPWFNNQVLEFRGKSGIFQPLVQPTIKSYYGCGAQLQYQDSQGNGDDTAANGLRIRFCDPIDWKIQQTKQIVGQFGNWKGMQMCPEGSYIVGFRVQNDNNQGKGDDTALNGLKIACRNPYALFDYNYLTMRVIAYQGLWGDWQLQGNWPRGGLQTYQRDKLTNKFLINIQKKYKFMNGFSTRYSKYYKGQDNTGMTGLIFQVEEFKFPENIKLKEMCYSPMEQDKLARQLQYQDKPRLK